MLFRVWCENNKEWETDNCSIDAYGNIIFGWTRVMPVMYKIELSTGLKDADGKEIFQGDIVEGTLYSAHSHTIIRSEIVWNKNSACFEARSYYKNCYEAHKVKFSRDVRVIGNIHESKNLLDRDEEENYVVQSLG